MIFYLEIALTLIKVKMFTYLATRFFIIRKDYIMNDFIDNKIIIPMNNFAKKHSYRPLTISTIALIVALLK